MNKEYEEAREKLKEIICRNCDGISHADTCELDKRDCPVLREMPDQILSLKGDGWRVALIKNDMSGVGKPNFKHVIWRAE